jgi:hypothetical protein
MNNIYVRGIFKERAIVIFTLERYEEAVSHALLYL